MKEIRFYKEKVAAYETVAKNILSEPLFHVGTTSDDFIRGSLTMKCERFLLARLSESQPITIDFAPPTFWDWLFQRRKTRTITFEAREVLRNPPLLPKGQSVLVYILKDESNGDID